MLALGLQSKREITRTRIRVRTAMATQTREQGRYLGGRPPYGYRLADAGPHPNKAHAAWGRRAHRLEPDLATAPVVAWMFAQRLAGHSAARITRALNDAGIPCPSATDPERNPHRTGTAWTLRTVAVTAALMRMRPSGSGGSTYMHPGLTAEPLVAAVHDRGRLILQRQFVIMRVFGLVGGSDSSGRWPGAGVAIGTSAAVPLVRPVAGTGR